MKKIFRVIRNVILTIVIIFMILLGIGILSNKDDSKSQKDSSEVTKEYKPQALPDDVDEEAIPDTSYFESFEDALEDSNDKEQGEKYQNHIDEVIEKIENENYVVLYFKSIKDSDEECITMAKFKKKIIDGREQYTFLQSIPTTVKRGTKTIGSLESLIADQLTVSDYIQNMNIAPEKTRFVFGDCASDEIYGLTVEGQKPTSIKTYETCGEKRYFWYFENLKSNRAGSSLSFEIDK